MADVEVDRLTAATPANVYKNFAIKSILGDANLFDATTAGLTLTNRYTDAADKYGAKLTVELINVTYEVDGVTYKCNKNDYTWDPDYGVITFTNNSGTLLADIVATFDVTFANRLDGVEEPESQILKVTFKK